MTIGSILDQQPDKLKGLQKILLMAFCISPFLSTLHTIMTVRTYLPLILYSAILSALCTFAHKRIDYQQIVLCRQGQRASALRLHPSAPYLHPPAPVCTATMPHTPHDMNSSATRTLRHRGSEFSVRATDFSTSLHIFF